MGKTVGIIGGLGPDATVDFMSRVLALTPAERDQDHVHMLVDNDPTVPCRQAALRGEGQDPGPRLAEMAKGLEAAGADFLVMPCNTAHAWADEIRAAVGIPLISMIDETVAACAEYGAVGLLSTTGCLDSGAYQQGLAASGKQLVVSADDELAEIMDIVFRVKAGDRDEELGARMSVLANTLADQGAEVVVVACTEIPLILNTSALRIPVVDSTEALAAATIARCVV